MKKALWLVAAVMVVGAGYAMLHGGGDATTQGVANVGASIAPDVSATPEVSPTPDVSTPVTATPSAAVASSVKTFNVDGGSFYFKPNVITVKKGDTVKIVFKNDDGFHDWVIDEFNARTSRIQGGQSATVEFVADRTGSFQYYCSVGSHRANGMWGTLVVK